MDDLDRDLLRFYIQLTPRQREVARLVSRGLTNQEVADRLFIAPSVVAGHLTNIYGLLINLECCENGRRANRYTLLRLLVGFFERHPEIQEV